ncbi:MAG: type II toxin-antitoxin system VapC family toxin [Terracidiphilus sp.]
MIILDTNVVSEFMRITPDARVPLWLDQQPRTSIWTTSVTVFEIRFGLETMPAGKRRNAHMASFERWLKEVVEERIAGYDEAAARRSAELAAERQRRGRPGELRDTMIAGIVLAQHAKLATRNVRHFEEIAASVVNPWALAVRPNAR